MSNGIIPLKYDTNIPINDKNIYNFLNNLDFYINNFIYKEGFISKYFSKNLKQTEKIEIKNKWKFMFNKINNILIQTKKISLEQYILITLYIKNYLNDLFIYIDSKKIDNYINYCLDILKKWFLTFKVFEKIQYIQYNYKMNTMPVLINKYNKKIEEEKIEKQKIINNTSILKGYINRSLIYLL